MLYGDKTSIPKSYWKALSEEELQKFQERVFDHYREHGFPFFDTPEEKMRKDLKSLEALDTQTLLKDGNVIRQTMTGLNVANTHMQHMQSTRCRGFRSPVECFENDDLLRAAIQKRINFGDNISDAMMRKALSFTHGTHRVSNFRPSVAKYIYDTYAGDGHVFDFSAGYGGRMVGAAVSSRVKSYTGTDPCTETFKSLLKLEVWLRENAAHKTSIRMDNIPCEDDHFFTPDYDSFDLAFSSPPYFNTEEYSDEETQSYKRYETPEEWMFGFLRPMIHRCHYALKLGGYFVINVANVNTYPNLIQDTIALAKEADFELVKTYHMELSGLMKSGYKHEPIFVFKKVIDD